VGLFTCHFVLLQVLLRAGRAGYGEPSFENEPPAEGKEAIKPYPSTLRTGFLPHSEAAGVGEQASRRSPGFEEGGSQGEGEHLWSARL